MTHDISKVYVDLSKCSVEELKSIPEILDKAGQELYVNDRVLIKDGKYQEQYLHLFYTNVWLCSWILVMKEEISYADFIKLFAVKEEYPGKRYQPLFDHLSQEHGLILHESEMDEIIRIVQESK